MIMRDDRGKQTLMECTRCNDKAWFSDLVWSISDTQPSLVERIKTQIAGEVEINHEDRHTQVAMICLLNWVEKLERGE